MYDKDEFVWRKALQAKGKDWVMAELRLRPGQPTDPLYDVVFEQPYPTRQFCLQWCVEQENKIFQVRWQSGAAFVALLLLVVCVLRAVSAWNEPVVKPPSAAGGGAAEGPQVTVAAPSWSNDNSQLPSTAGTGSGTTGTTGSTTKSLPSICSYQTYQTAECKVQP